MEGIPEPGLRPSASGDGFSVSPFSVWGNAGLSSGHGKVVISPLALPLACYYVLPRWGNPPQERLVSELLCPLLVPHA